MHICGFEKMSLVDYDGLVAATVFTGGCNFRCGFCHNSALVLSHKDIPAIDTEAVLSYLKKRKGVLDGVCVSGGEPTLQKDLPEFLSSLKELGYKVKLDTNGTNPTLIKRLFSDKLVDYFAMDIKADKEVYPAIIDVPNYDLGKVLESVEFLLSLGDNYEFRTTLISEFHGKENMVNIGKWIKGANKYFLQKFKNSENCIQSHLSAVEEKTALEFRDILREYVPNTHLRGY